MNVPVARLVLLVAALTAAGAGCDDGAIELGRDDSARGPESTFLILPEEGEGGAVPGPSPGGGGAGGAPTPGEGSPSGDDGSTPPITDGGTTSTTRSDGGLAVDDRAGVGTMGRAFLRGDVTDVVVEVDMTPGESLTNQSRSAVLEQIEDRGNKTSVGFVTGSTLPEQSVYTTDQLRSLMEAHRSAWSTDERLAVYVMVLSGQHQDGTTVGVAFNASAFAVFPDQLAGGLLGLNYPNYEEGTVVHELGHLFGLVNLTGEGAFHEDPDHEGHSRNTSSVMHWAVESTVVGDVFEGGPPRDFDTDDEQEMQAIRTG